MIDMQNTHVLESGISEGGVRETTIGELLPDSFGPEHLDMPRSMVWEAKLISALYAIFQKNSDSEAPLFSTVVNIWSAITPHITNTLPTLVLNALRVFYTGAVLLKAWSLGSDSIAQMLIEGRFDSNWRNARGGW
jgi:hypothetical protein